MPKVELLWTNRHKAQVVRSLRPRQVQNLTLGAIDSDKFQFSLDIIDGDSVLVVFIDGGNVAAARAEADGSYTLRILL